MRRITSGAPARAASRRPRPTSWPRRWRASRRRSSSRRRSTAGPQNLRPAAARSRYASSSTRSCSARTRTRPSTRPWSRPAAPRTGRRSICCRPRAPSTRPTSSTGSAFCSRTSPRARPSHHLPRRSRHRTCRWPTCRPIPSTTRKPPRSTTPCRCAAWARGRSPWAYTLPRPAWRYSPAATWTSWAASACPRSTCRATRSPCCPTRWCRSTPWTRAAPTRPCRCT